MASRVNKQRTPLPPPLAGRAFAVADARALGVPARRLRAKDLQASLRGVRIPARTPTGMQHEQTCQGLLGTLPPGAAFSHVTALRLWGVEIPWPHDADGEIHVLVPESGTAPQREGVRTHTRRRVLIPTTTLRGLPLATPEHAWLSLAQTLQVDELVVVADAMLRRMGSLTSVARLQSAVRMCPPRTRGVRRLREALALVRPGTDSSMETRTRLVLVRGGLACPEVNQDVRDADGRFLARPDMLYRRERVVVEFDGDGHRTDKAQWRRDVARRQALEAAGWRMVTATADDVLRHPERLLGWVCQALARASSR